MKSLKVLLIALIIWGLVFSVVDAWSLPQRSKVSVSQMSRPIPLQFMIIRQQWATRAEQHRMTNAAVTYLRNNRVRANPRWRRWVDDPFKHRVWEELESAPSVFAGEFTFWRDRLEMERVFRPFTTTAVIAPPWTVESSRFIAGFAFLNSYYGGGYSYSNVHMFNTSGQSRYRHSVVGIIHEILHTLGCGHEDGPNIMHPAALAEQQAIEGTGMLLTIGPKCRAVLDKLPRGK